MSLTSINKKGKRSTGKRVSKKKQIENKLNSFNIFNNELGYDLSIDDEYKSSLLQRDMTINYKKIESLPTYNIEFLTKTEDNDNTEKKKISKKIIEKTNNDEVEEIEDDNKSHTIEKVGNVYYKFDYDKGIIYDLKMNEVGHIDDYGEICMMNEEENEEEDETI
jgi:hypothetical protein